MPFHPNDLPAPALKAFNKHFKTPIMWPLVVQEAVNGGVRDVNTLTDIVFYMHHWDRILEPIKPGETKLINEWKAFRTLVQPSVPGWVKQSTKGEPGTASGGAADWVLTDTEAWAIQREWGKEVAEWAKIPPVGTEAKEFKPVAGKQADYKTVLAWKTENAKSSCVANPRKRIQIAALLRDDWAYWNKRTGGSALATETLKTTAATTIRDYRDYVINRKMCPPAAYQKLVQVNRDVTFQLFLGMFQLLSPEAAGPMGPNLKGLGRDLGNFNKSQSTAASKVPDLVGLLVDIVSGKKKREQS